MVPSEKSKLVYSTDRAIPRTGGAGKEKAVDKALRANVRPGQQGVTVRLDRKGRGGKSVTLIENLPMSQDKREALLNQLKTELGAGGTVRDAALEIQGDHRDAVTAALEEMGYRPKRSGG
jgi:translation initiation factor 1